MPKVLSSGVEFLDQDTGLFELSALELVLVLCLIWYLAAQGFLGDKVKSSTQSYLGADPASRLIAWYKGSGSPA